MEGRAADWYDTTMANGDELTFQFLAENSVDLMCRCDMDTTMRYVSPSCVRILGWTPNEMTGQRMDGFILAEDMQTFLAAVARANSPGVETEGATLRMRRKNGSACWMEISASIVRDPITGRALSAAVSMRDVSERKLLEEKLAILALTDGLTGLPNRRAFDHTLEIEWKRTLREGSHMSLLLLDIDHFKLFNDRYGHQVGDDCLRAVAAAVQRAVRGGIDTPTRYGGEEIAVVLPRTDGAGAVVVAEKVRQAILDLRLPHAGNVENGGLVTASFGVATALARHGGTMKMPESVLMSADMALYRAKHGGRNRVATMLLVASRDAEHCA